MRISNDWKNIVTTTAGVIGILSSVLTFFTSSFNKSGLYLGGGIIITTFLLILAIRKWIPKGNMPDGIDDVAEEMASSVLAPRFKVIFPCDDRYYQAANKLAREKFGKNSVSRRTVDDWKKRNEYILTCLTDNNRMVGYFDILPLNTDFALKLIKGDVTEKDIAAEHIISAHDVEKAEYIYIAGIAVQDTHSGKGCIHGTYLLASAMQYVKLFYKNSNLQKILTIPTSECGLKLTKRLQFTLERSGNLRKDGCDIYSKEFKISEIETLIQENQRLYRRFDYSSYHRSGFAS